MEQVKGCEMDGVAEANEDLNEDLAIVATLSNQTTSRQLATMCLMEEGRGI
ncbi:hypothetical protein JCGZ_15534 [Jatropha curcas]|uniref:Uncharacterized protein n=1 Tax=Jatropha curcas TaxID=180498 RepID=A0A067K6X1_JATCU|nr:hypothetical protein JCGZ_15534 [Jatropha curcas]